MNINHVFSQLWRLDAADWRSLVRMKCQFLTLRATLPLVSIAKVECWAGQCKRRVAEAKASTSLSDTRIQRLARLVDIASRRGPVRATCLVKSLVLKRALSEIGIESVLRIGVDKSDRNGFAAHAWLELDGRPINDRSDVSERFAAFPSIPPQIAQAASTDTSRPSLL